MTGIERLREWERSQDETTWCPPGHRCPDSKADEPSPCRRCMKSYIADIADQIEREMLPWPHFEDGTAVRVGDMVCDNNGMPQIAKDIRVYRDGYWRIACNNEWIYGTAYKRLKRPEPTDSWERLEADVATGDACRYFGVEDVCEDECRECTGCPAHGAKFNCGEAMAADVLRRCKELAGVEP